MMPAMKDFYDKNIRPTWLVRQAERAGRVLQQLFGPLVRPHASIQDVEEKQKSQLQASLSLIIAFFMIVGTLAALGARKTWMPAMTDQLLLALLSLLAYGLTRYGKTRLGAFVLILPLLLAPITGSGRENPNILISLYSFIPLGLVLGSALLSAASLFLLTLFTCVVLWFLPSFASQISSLQASTLLGNILALGVALSILAGYRKATDRLRLSQAESANQELRELSADLERRVQSRTNAAERARAEAEKARREAESARNALEEQMWFTSGQAALAEKIRGDQPVEQLGENIITLVTEYLGAQSGALYLLEKKSLRLIGSHAFQPRAGFDGTVETGEGWVGQAVLDRTPRLIPFPQDSMLISSGLLDLRPRQLLVAPFGEGGKVHGVLELATLAEFSPKDIHFLNQIGETISIAFRTARAHRDLADLLLKTQLQAEELQAQEEELRAANEELQAQAETLSLEARRQAP